MEITPHELEGLHIGGYKMLIHGASSVKNARACSTLLDIFSELMTQVRTARKSDRIVALR